ncbi:hypothetical protein CN553_30990 [Bacillus cereus]|uniref:Uncharacterized protein n=1 Tax=Bacillus cereus TaxID=1396 RepID=A0A9X6U5I5_BACCE|nr:hypothetical protein CN553_30990 [Bacillus cereus]
MFLYEKEIFIFSGLIFLVGLSVLSGFTFLTVSISLQFQSLNGFSSFSDIHRIGEAKQLNNNVKYLFSLLYLKIKEYSLF